MVPPHSADEEVTGVALSIAFGVTGCELEIGRRVMGVEQPAAEREVVAAPATGKKAVAANAVEAVRQGMQQETADELVGIEVISLVLPSWRLSR